MAERFYSPPIQGSWEQARSPLNDRLRAIERMLQDISTGAGIPGSRITAKAITAEKIDVPGLDDNGDISISDGLITTPKLAAGAVTAEKMTITDLIDIANKLTLASGRVVIDKNAFGANLEGIIINDETYNRVEIGELTSGNYGMKLRDSSGNVTVDMGELAGESDKKNLVVKVNATYPAYKIDVDADHIKLDDTSLLLKNVNLTMSITTSGANGLDTGSEAANTWYAILVIYNPTTKDIKGLFTISPDSPTLPEGYTKSRRVGWVRNNASSNFLKFWHTGDWWYFDARQAVLSTADPAVVYTDVNCNVAAPPTSIMVSVYAFLRDDENTYCWVKLRRNGSSGDWVTIGSNTATPRMTCAVTSCICDSSQKIEYKAESADMEELSLWILGYRDSI